MKPSLFLSLLLVASITVSLAQDTLVMRNDSIKLVKVLQIFVREVQYKPYDKQEGEAITELKTNIKAVKFANGYVEQYPLAQLIAADSIYKASQAKMNERLVHVGPRLYYHDTIVHRTDLTRILLNSNDKAVIKLELQSQRSERLSCLGLVAIPFAVCAAGGALAYLFGADSGLFTAGCAIIAVPLVIIGGNNLHNINAYKKDAIKLYNLKY